MSSPQSSTTTMATSVNFQAYNRPALAPSVPKLRDSCDACAASKVKCHKQKPTCSRCMRRRLACEYGTSKRGGRSLRAQDTDTDQPSRSGTNESSARASVSPVDTDSLFGDNAIQAALTATSMAAEPAQTPGTSSSYSSLSSLSHLFAPSGRTANTITTVPTPSGQDLSFLLTDCLNGSLEEYMQDQDPFLLPLNYDNSTLDHITPFNNLDGDGSRSFLNFHSPVEASDAEDASHAMPEPMAQLQPEVVIMEGMESEKADSCCLFAAFVLMRGLFPKSSGACTSSTDGATTPEPTNGKGAVAIPTIEDVITKNQRAIDSLMRMLQCSCARDSYLLALISLIMSKVLAWYDAAAWVQQVRQAPAVISNYRLKGEDSGRMAAQLVLSELNHVQRLMNALEKITHEVTQPARSQCGRTMASMALDVCMDETMQTSSRDESTSAFSLLVLDKMIGHLQEKLKIISRGIVTKLNAH